MKPDSRVLRDAGMARAAAEKLHTQFRMTEGNTCYRGGKPGFSDVFAATLWAADYLLLLASLGYAGVNLHGGRGKEVADSLGGRLPGEQLMPDPTAPHPRPFYTPIQDQEDGHYLAEPVYFGMLFAQHFAGARMLKLDFDPRPVNATAYAARRADGKKIVAIINKDAARSLSVKLPGRHVCTTSLTAPSLDSKSVSWNGTLLAREISRPGERNTEMQCGGFRTDFLNVPATSAMLIEME